MADYQPNTDVEKLFKDRQDERVGLIKESILDIQNMITERGKLHSQLLDSLANIELFVDNKMPKIESISTNTLPQKSDIIKELLKKKIDLQELKIEENLNVWRDIAMLKRELREHMKEFRDMQSKTSMLDNILEIDS